MNILEYELQNHNYIFNSILEEETGRDHLDDIEEKTRSDKQWELTKIMLDAEWNDDRQTIERLQRVTHRSTGQTNLLKALMTKYGISFDADEPDQYNRNQHV